KVAEDTTSTLKFSISKVLFEDIGLTYHDDVAGNDVKLHLGEFTTKIKTFDLNKQRYLIKQLSLKNTSLNYLQQKPLTQLVQHISKSVDSAEKEQGKLPYIEVEDFVFNNIKLNYDDQLSATRALAVINTLGLAKLKVDLTNSKYEADEAKLHQSNILFAFKPAPASKTSTAKKDTVTTAPSPLALLLKKIDLQGNSFQFDNLGAKPTNKGIDFNHLNISGLNLGANNVSYNASGIKANVENGTLRDKKRVYAYWFKRRCRV
ncbi:MAG: hypothetical protein B0A82_09405, partial [Alkalinema sp. CACIAM 70d]